MDEVSVVNRLREAYLSYWIYADHGTLGNKNNLMLCINVAFVVVKLCLNIDFL